MAVNYGRLSKWSGIWDELTKEREDLLLGRTVPNLIGALLSNLRRQRANNKWKAELERLLRETLNENLAVVRLIRIEHGAEADQLTQLLHTRAKQNNREKEQTDDQVCAILDKIKDAPSNALLEQELRNELLIDDTADDERLIAITVLILSRAVTRHAENVFTDPFVNLPKRILGRHAAALLLEEHVTSFVEDLRLGREVLDRWRSIFEKGLTENKMWSYVKKDASSLFDLFSDGSWSALARDLIDDLPEKLTEILREPKDGDNESVCTGENVTAGGAQRLGRWVVERYVRAFLRHLFHLFTESVVDKRTSPLDKTGHFIVGHLSNKCGFIDNRGWMRKQNSAAIANLAVEALARAISNTLPPLLCDAALDNDIEQLTTDVGSRLVKLFGSADASSGANWSEMTDEALYQSCFNCSIRTDVQQDLAKMLLPLNEKIIQGLDKLLRGEGEKRLAEWSLDMRSFWDEWRISFSQPKFSSDILFQYAPWSRVTEEQLGQMIEKFFEYLFPAPTRFQVVFKVTGIKPEGVTWSVGDVTFYDPDVLDYGEGSCLFFQPRWPERDDLTYARVEVAADTFEVAWEVALQALNNALNALSFALSAGVQAGGLKPEIINEYFIARLRPRWRSYKAGKERAELSMSQSAKGHRIPEIAKACDYLLSLSSREPERLTPLQVGFLRALHWYRKGRWEPDFAERFLFYWIGLEHLFTGSEFQPGAIFKNVPKLHITWQDWRSFYWVPISLNAIMKNIQENEDLRSAVALTPELREWRSDTKILLQPANLMLLASLTPSKLSQIRAFFERTANEFEEKASKIEQYERQIEHLRELFLFKLNLLSDLRNEMVHEARPHRAGIRMYSEALEGILEDVLRKIAAVVTQEAPKYRTIEELAEWHQFPWGQNTPSQENAASAAPSAL